MEKIPDKNSSDSIKRLDTESQIEDILSLEVKKEILEKSRDINENGTAFSVIDFYFDDVVGGEKTDKLKSILHYGLVGMSAERKVRAQADIGAPNSVDDYLNDLNQNEMPKVYFSIVNRSYEHNEAKLSKDGPLGDRVRYYEWLWGDGQHGSEKGKAEPVAVAFNLNSFKEFDRKPASKLERGYTVHGSGEYGGSTMASDDQYGFKLSPRVPPRLFTGIIFKSVQGGELVSDPEMEKRLRSNQNPIDGNGVEFSKADFELVDREVKWADKKYYHLTPDIEGSRRKARLLAQEMMRFSKPENWVPIYDYYGNMWWPEEISNEEIIRMKVREKYDFTDDQYNLWEELKIKYIGHSKSTLPEDLRERYEKWERPRKKHWVEEEEDFIAEYVKSKE